MASARSRLGMLLWVNTPPDLIIIGAITQPRGERRGQMLHVVTAPTAYPFQIIEIVLGASLMPSTVLLVKEGMLPAEAIKALRDLFAGCTIFRTPSCPAVDDTQAA